MSMPVEWYEEYRAMVRTVAARWGYKYNGYVELVDIEQELWLWLNSHVENVLEWKEQHETRIVDSLIAKSFSNAAYDYCLREKLARTGVEYDDIFWYTPEFIKTMLPGALLDDWKRIKDLAEASISKSFKSKSEGNDWVAYVADIKKAYELLSEDDKLVVLEFYGKDQSAADVKNALAKAYGEQRSGHALAMAAHRAVKKMSKFLGGMPPRRS
jgi:hypothetical protein